MIRCDAVNHMNNKKLIESALIDTVVILSHSFIKNVKFYYIENYGCTWKATRKDSPIDIYPMKSLNYVKYFATLKNAKRNFIKRYSTD